MLVPTREPLNLFYEEPDPDRWVPFDRYPRRVVRRLVRGAPQPGGQQRVFLNLCAGLDELGVPYRVNDYRHALRNPGELACVVGKPFVLDKVKWRNPILFGASVFSHPTDDVAIFDRLPVRKVLVPGGWMEDMCKPYWGDRVEAWPVGIDTRRWSPAAAEGKTHDVLLYNKIRWQHERMENELLGPVRRTLESAGVSFMELRYGSYREEQFEAALRVCRTMIFICEHETQGIAYQQALSCDVPILAWDRGGPWQDPTYYPHRVVYGPVSSVPYWDARCGERFATVDEFGLRLQAFIEHSRIGRYRPRDFILEGLTLAQCARRYVEIARQVQDGVVD